MMKHFLSCDWGTSSFRLRLIEADSLRVLAEIRSNEGIADTYRAWLEQKDPVERQVFYLRIIKEQVEELGRQAYFDKVRLDLSAIPVVLSGMASSTIGLVDIPYKQLPFALDGSDLKVKVIKEHSPNNPLVIISGVCSADDVMRGEETKILGCADAIGSGPVQLLMPGTHPKHILIQEGQVTGFKTYMTGEFFDLLSSQSVLSGSVKVGANLEEQQCEQHFHEGVAAGAKGNILNTSFMVRTRQVLDKVPEEYNFHYLSGLLIGCELNDLDRTSAIYLVSSGVHTSLYSEACAVLGIKIVQVIGADWALIRGQQAIFARSRYAGSP